MAVASGKQKAKPLLPRAKTSKLLSSSPEHLRCPRPATGPAAHCNQTVAVALAATIEASLAGSRFAASKKKCGCPGSAQNIVVTLPEQTVTVALGNGKIEVALAPSSFSSEQNIAVTFAASKKYRSHSCRALKFYKCASLTSGSVRRPCLVGNEQQPLVGVSPW